MSKAEIFPIAFHGILTFSLRECDFIKGGTNSVTYHHHQNGELLLSLLLSQPLALSDTLPLLRPPQDLDCSLLIQMIDPAETIQF